MTALQRFLRLPMQHQAGVLGAMASIGALLIMMLTMITPGDVQSHQAQNSTLPTQDTGTRPQSAHTASRIDVRQNTSGASSPAVNAGSGDVHINYGTIEVPEDKPAVQAPAAPESAITPEILAPPGSANSASVQQQSHGPNSPVINAPGSDASVTIEYERYAPPYPEPTAAQMQEAVLDAMALAGGQRTQQNVIEVNNFLAGGAIEIVTFEKLGCAPAEERSGYFCDYHVVTRMRMHSNEGSAAADRHAQAINNLFGRDRASMTQGRFIKHQDRWRLAAASI